jgi:hypothetical protein
LTSYLLLIRVTGRTGRKKVRRGEMNKKLSEVLSRRGWNKENKEREGI